MIGFHPPTHAPERVALTCPLGLRFFDIATGGFVRDGLHATAWPAGTSQRKMEPVVTPSGVLAFHGLPGLRRFENSSAEDPWNPPPVTQNFQVEVVDELGRFLPCTFAILAPVKGLATFADDGSPPWIEAGAVPLFSAASRIVTGLAVVRAELRELATGREAAWAFVEAAYSSAGSTQIARGLADDAGSVTLMFAYPEGQRRAFGTSPLGGVRSLAEQEWTLDLSFFHQPAADPERAADYAKRLTQPAVHALRGVSPLTLVGEATLVFGRELSLGKIELTPA